MAALDSRYTQVGFNLISVQVCIEGTRCSLTAGDFFQSLIEVMNQLNTQHMLLRQNSTIKIHVVHVVNL